MAGKYALLEEEEPNIRIALVGKTGVGKSAAGNTILRGNPFQSQLSPSTETSECKKETGAFEGQILAVVDTPGLFDSNANQEKVKREIARCISFVSPGPHVFLVVLQIGRFTKEEQETVKIIQEMFGEKLADYTMALFTHGEKLEDANMSIEEFIGKNEDLHVFIKQCRGGYHVFEKTNKDPSQVRELLKKINSMVQRNGGGYYTNEMFEEAERAIREEMQRLLRENPELMCKEARRQAEENNSFIRNVLALSTSGGVVVGALAGVGVEIAVGAGIGSVVGPVGALAGAAVGAGVGLTAAAVAVAVKKKACVIQ